MKRSTFVMPKAHVEIILSTCTQNPAYLSHAPSREQSNISNILTIMKHKQSSRVYLDLLAIE